MTNDKNTTKLSELPNNTDNDTDLVNKILNQLDTSNDSIPPTFDLEQPPTENPVIKNQINKTHVSKSQLKPNISNPVVQKTVVEQRNPIYSSNNEQMPSPQGIQKVLNSMDMDYIYKIVKMSIFYTVIFIGFIFCTNIFVDMFSKIPYISFTTNNELNNSGKVLQSICFGAIYFLINFFFPN
tara:strand:- start:3080 stop:3625 length:546 start_codon:yes stop_codon:yes gene_type:complete